MLSGQKPSLKPAELTLEDVAFSQPEALELDEDTPDFGDAFQHLPFRNSLNSFSYYNEEDAPASPNGLMQQDYELRLNRMMRKIAKNPKKFERHVNEMRGEEATPGGVLASVNTLWKRVTS